MRSIESVCVVIATDASKLWLCRMSDLQSVRREMENWQTKRYQPQQPVFVAVPFSYRLQRWYGDILSRT